MVLARCHDIKPMISINQPLIWFTQQSWLMRWVLNLIAVWFNWLCLPFNIHMLNLPLHVQWPGRGVLESDCYAHLCIIFIVSLWYFCSPPINYFFQLIKSPSKAASGNFSAKSPLREPNKSPKVVSTVTHTSESSTEVTSLPFSTSSLPMQAVHVNPMDNVPFVPSLAAAATATGGVSRSYDGHSFNDPLRTAYASLDRISLYLASSSQSQYNFLLERSVIQEPSSSPTPWLTNERKDRM